MHPETKEQVSQLREVNTRKSKTTARHKVHSAFNAHLKQVYGHSQMAKFFLKYPPAALNSLLAALNSLFYQLLLAVLNSLLYQLLPVLNSPHQPAVLNSLLQIILHSRRPRSMASQMITTPACSHPPHRKLHPCALACHPLNGVQPACRCPRLSTGECFMWGVAVGFVHYDREPQVSDFVSGRSRLHHHWAVSWSSGTFSLTRLSDQSMMWQQHRHTPQCKFHTRTSLVIWHGPTL